MKEGIYYFRTKFGPFPTYRLDYAEVLPNALEEDRFINPCLCTVCRITSEVYLITIEVEWSKTRNSWSSNCCNENDVF